MNLRIQPSTEFKKKAASAVSSISFFIIVYVILVILSIFFGIFCFYAAYFILTSLSNFWGLVFAIGMAGLGLSIVFFLFKFAFASNETDESHLLQIFPEDEPELFNLVESIADAVGTDRPKKIFLSSEVNASVFYDSNFWSMFLPVKKNLSIGIGLINTVTKDELKSILAHEFGHFSQRSMKVGSYVYNANKIIYNLLFENEDYTNLMQSFNKLSGYFGIFISAGSFIVSGIQFILKKLYEVMNVSYMGLSREMEFHADEIAVRLTGSDPLKNSLWRMQLSDYAFYSVLNYYDQKLSQNLTSSNIYAKQSFVVNFQAALDNTSYKGGFPLVSEIQQARFNKSRLEVNNQWASHPSTKERVAKMESLGLFNPDYDFTPANDLLRKSTYYQEHFTNQIFSKVAYTDARKVDTTEAFVNGYEKEYVENSFPKIYNNYYDNYELQFFELDGKPVKTSLTIDDLFNDEKTEWVYTRLAILGDIGLLEQIRNGDVKVKTFDYDGVKYKAGEAATLIEQLNEQKKRLDEMLLDNDRNILSFFYYQAEQKGLDEKLMEHYNTLSLYDAGYEDRMKRLSNIQEALQFTQVTTPYNIIESKFENLKEDERQLKYDMHEFLNNELYKVAITAEVKEHIEAYINNNEDYFLIDAYNDDALTKLYVAMHNYAFAIGRVYFTLKKNLLEFQQSTLSKEVSF